MNLNTKYLKSIAVSLLLMAGFSFSAYACPLHGGDGAKEMGENHGAEVSDSKAPASAN